MNSTVGRSWSSAARPHPNRVLAGLPAADMAALARYLQTVSLEPGAVAQTEDGSSGWMYFPHEGVISLLATTPDGHSVEAASVGRGGAVCPILEPDGSPGMLAAVALSPTVVSRVEVAHLQTIRQESKELNRALWACRQTLLLQVYQNVACGPLHSLERRLSRWLLETADHAEADLIPFPVSQEMVAQRMGTRRTSVTLVAGKLQQVGAIRWGRARVEILDRAQLEARACTCYATLMERRSAVLSHERRAPR